MFSRFDTIPWNIPDIQLDGWTDATELLQQSCMLCIASLTRKHDKNRGILIQHQRC